MNPTNGLLLTVDTCKDSCSLPPKRFDLPVPVLSKRPLHVLSRVNVVGLFASDAAHVWSLDNGQCSCHLASIAHLDWQDCHDISARPQEQAMSIYIYTRLQLADLKAFSVKGACFSRSCRIRGGTCSDFVGSLECCDLVWVK